MTHLVTTPCPTLTTMKRPQHRLIVILTPVYGAFATKFRWMRTHPLRSSGFFFFFVVVVVVVVFRCNINVCDEVKSVNYLMENKPVISA